MPGFLLAAHGGVAALDGLGRIAAELPPNADVTLQLPTECPGCRVTLDADAGATAQLASASSLRVNTDRLTHVRGIVLSR